MTSDSEDLCSVKTLSRDKSHEVAKVESVMKAQAWASGINTANPATSSAGYIGSSHQLLQSQTATLLQSADGQSATAWQHPVVQSEMQPSVVQLNTAAVTMVSSLPRNMSPNSTAAESMAVENVLNPWLPSTITADSLAFSTPMKRVDSISASTGHTKTSANEAVSENNLSSTRRLHYGSDSGDGRGRDNYVAGNRYTKRLDSHLGQHPHVQSIADHHSNDASKLKDTASADVRNVQQQHVTRTVVHVHVSSHSAALDNVASSQVNVNDEIPSSSVTPVETVSDQSSTAEYAVAADFPVDAGRVQLLRTLSNGTVLSHENKRLNELWNRFTLDHSVCCPKATDSGTTFSASSVEQTGSDVIESSTHYSDYRHSEQSFVYHAASGKAEDAKNQQCQSSSDEFQTSNRSSSAAVFTADVVHAGNHHSSTNSNDMPQHITVRSLREAGSNVDDKSKSGKPNTGDAGNVSSLSAVIPVKRAWIIKDEALPVVPEDTTLDSVSSDFTSASSVDDMGNVITCTTKRHLPNDPKLVRLQQKIAQQREKHKIVHRNEQRRKEHILKMELALQERQKAIEQRTCDVQKMGADHSSSQLEMTTSSTMLTTVTSNDSDVTSSVQHHSTDNSQFQSANDTSASCLCHEAQCAMHRVINPKENGVFLQKQHKSETKFRPELREVKYAKTKATKSAPSVLSREKISLEQERNAEAKNVRRSIISSSASHGSRVPETGGLKNAQGDQRSRSKIIKSSKITKPSSQSKASYSNRVLTEKNKQVTKERGMQSKAVQTTPRLKDSRVLYSSTAVQCPANCGHFDELGIISCPGVSGGQRARSLSSTILSPDSSTDAELLQCLKYQSLVKHPVRASLPRELFAYYQRNLCLLCNLYRGGSSFDCCLSVEMMKYLTV